MLEKESFSSKIIITSQADLACVALPQSAVRTNVLRWCSLEPSVPSKLSYSAMNADMAWPTGYVDSGWLDREMSKVVKINIARKYSVFQRLLRIALSFCLKKLGQLYNQTQRSVHSLVGYLSSSGHTAYILYHILTLEKKNLEVIPPVSLQLPAS